VTRNSRPEKPTEDQVPRGWEVVREKGPCTWIACY
jgi:hypothetical protein